MATRQPKKKPDANTTTVYMTKGGSIFSEKDLKQYEVGQSQQIEETKFGVDIIKPPHDPAKLMNWLDISVVHASCVHVKVNDTVGRGWYLGEIKDKKASESDRARLNTFFGKVNAMENITKVSKKVALDYESCGTGYFEIVRDIRGKGIKSIYHVNAATIRMTKDKKRWIQKIGQQKVFFKMWGEKKKLNKDSGIFGEGTSSAKQANELIQVIQYTHKSKYYGLPDWLPAIQQMYGEMKEREYNLDFFTNHGIPAYAVILTGTKLDEGAEDFIKKYFETEIKGNPHKTMVFKTPMGATIKFEKLSVEKKEASFRIYRKDNRDDILTAHHVPPYRAAIVEKGQMGGDVSPDMDRIYLDSVINPRQADFTWIITELIIKEGFEIDTLEFFYQDIDIRDDKMQSEIDGKYFAMGARTANEMLIAQGREPYEGGDVYYVAGNLVPVGQIEEEKTLFKGKKHENTDKNKKGTKAEDTVAAQDYK